MLLPERGISFRIFSFAVGEKGLCFRVFRNTKMEFHFNFCVDRTSENGTDADENEKLQEGMNNQTGISEKSSDVTSEENNRNQEYLIGITSNASDYSTLNASSDTNLLKKQSCPKSAKLHNIPKDVSEVLENKVVQSFPGIWANISVLYTVLPGKCVGENIASKSISSQSDLISGVYEGGLKIWECTFDLIDYLSESEIQFTGKLVLDLGCGAGLLGIVALKGNAEGVHFQDYNSLVIEEITIPSILANFTLQYDDVGDTHLLNQSRKKEFAQDLLSKSKFFSGEWSEFSKLVLNSTKPTNYDLILTSETIYNPNYYEAFHDALSSLLAINGSIFLAGKAHYFGCGGGIHLFISFLEKKNVFKSRIVKVIDKGLKHFIIELTFKNSC